MQRHGQPDTLILRPAALVGQIDRVLARRPETVKALSYERLANPSAVDTRIDFVPSLVILDEAHRVSRDSVVYRILQRLKERHNPTIVCMTGTLMRRSLRDYAHLFALALDENSPLPRDPGEIDLWADALDENVPYDRRARPDAICRLFDTPSKDLDTLRSLLYASLSEHPGLHAALGRDRRPGSDDPLVPARQMFRLSGSGSGRPTALRTAGAMGRCGRQRNRSDGQHDPSTGSRPAGSGAPCRSAGYVSAQRSAARILIAQADWEHLVKQRDRGRACALRDGRADPVDPRDRGVQTLVRGPPLPPVRAAGAARPGLDPLFSVPSPRPGPVIGLPPEIGRWIAQSSQLRYFGAGDDIPGQPSGGVFDPGARDRQNLQHYQDAIVLEPPTGPAQIRAAAGWLDRTGQELPVTYHFYFLTKDRYRSWLTRACDDARVVFQHGRRRSSADPLKAEHR